MDQEALVEVQIQDGQRLLERLSAEGIPVTAAAWVKESEGGPWYFYLITPLVTEEGGTLPVYRRVGPLVGRMPQPFWVDPMVVTVAGPASAVGKAICDIAARRPGHVPLSYGGARLGGLSIDGAYVYPPVAAAVG